MSRSEPLLELDEGTPRPRRWHGPVALMLLFLACAGPIVQEYTAQAAPRYALAAALVEHQTVVLDRYDEIVLVDRMEHDGHLYSDKAPGQSFFSVPAYAIARAAGAEPARDVRVRGDLGVWFVTFWSSTLPALALVLLMAHAARPLGEHAAVVGAAGVAFGTLILPFSAELYGHLLSAALGFAAWRILRDRRPTALRSAAAGLVAGLAVAVEYPAAIVAVALAIWLLVRHRRLLGAYVLGGIPAAVGLAAYQWAVLGDPFASAYSQKPQHEQASPLVTGIPKPVQGLEILFGSRGLLLFTPIVAAGVWGLWRLARRDHDRRDDAIVGLGVLTAFFLLQAGWVNPWGGEMPGPRYMIPGLPFLAIGIAEAWTGRRRLVSVLLAISVFSMLWPLLARHLVPDGGWLIESQMTDVRLAGFMPTLFTMALGWSGWIVHGALVVLAARGVERILRHGAGGSTGPPVARGASR